MNRLNDHIILVHPNKHSTHTSGSAFLPEYNTVTVLKLLVRINIK